MLAITQTKFHTEPEYIDSIKNIIKGESGSVALFLDDWEHEVVENLPIFNNSHLVNWKGQVVAMDEPSYKWASKHFPDVSICLCDLNFDPSLLENTEAFSFIQNVAEIYNVEYKQA